MKNKLMLPKLRLVAIAEDEATSKFLAVISFRDRDGKVRPINLPLAKLDDRKALIKTLTNSGAYFATDQEKNERALRKLIASRRKAKRFNFAARVGWYRGYRMFVLPSQVIGVNTSGVAIQPPRLTGDRHAAGSRGTHQEW